MTDTLVTYVLDTNVLMHDPSAIFSFKQHDIFIPMVVLEELDAGKKGLSEVSQNVRQVSRFFDDLVQSKSHTDIADGLSLPSGGRLFFQTNVQSIEGQSADNSILSVAFALAKEHADREIRLVSKDINLRIKATVLGLCAEDYSHDQVLDDADILYAGCQYLASATWQQLNDAANTTNYAPNEFVTKADSQRAEDVRRVTHTGTLQPIVDYSTTSVWGITAKNLEQNCALNLLLDPQCEFVTLLGGAGSGKTLLTLAAGLNQVMEQQHYKEIIMTRATVAIGEDIGYLPGTEEEKMTPWMGAVMDNLEVLTENSSTSGWGREASAEFLLSKIKLRSLSFMRGRTFLQRLIIIDEAQNLTAKQMKTLITRAGKGSKIVCLGNIAQIDTPYLTETTSGLTFAVERFRQWQGSGHIILKQGERSALADFAAQAL